MAYKPFFFMPLLLLLCAAAMAVGTDAQCAHADLFVYTLGTLCYSPAQYTWRYRFVSASDRLSGLAPEWDETNSTYYVRLSSTGDATYSLTYPTRERRAFVSTFDRLYIRNVDTGRYLGWRDEGGEKFLVELSSNSESEFLTYLRFNQSSFDQLACILPYPPRACNPYGILLYDEEFEGDGVGAYIEDGVTYFKLQSDVFPFLLIKENSGSAASSSSAAPINGLKMPTYS